MVPDVIFGLFKTENLHFQCAPCGRTSLSRSIDLFDEKSRSPNHLSEFLRSRGVNFINILSRSFCTSRLILNLVLFGVEQRCPTHSPLATCGEWSFCPFEICARKSCSKNVWEIDKRSWRYRGVTHHRSPMLRPESMLLADRRMFRAGIGRDRDLRFRRQRPEPVQKRCPELLQCRTRRPMCYGRTLLQPQG